jgi:hypothetical protein
VTRGGGAAVQGWSGDEGRRPWVALGGTEARHHHEGCFGGLCHRAHTRDAGTPPACLQREMLGQTEALRALETMHHHGLQPWRTMRVPCTRRVDETPQSRYQ